MVTAVELIEHPRRGRLRARIEALERRLVPPPPVATVAGHPLPDLSGASPGEIAAALVEAISAAHGDSPPWASDDEGAAGHGLCPACLVTLEEARRMATGGAELALWPDPLLAVFEDEYQWRIELERWADQPRVRFDRAVWSAEQERMQAEHFYTDRYRGQIPPWVIVGDRAD